MALPPPAKDMSQGDILANQSKRTCGEGQRAVGSTCPAVEKRHVRAVTLHRMLLGTIAGGNPRDGQKRMERTQTAYDNYVLELLK